MLILFVRTTRLIRHVQPLRAFPISNVSHARSEKCSALTGFFRNRWLWSAGGLSVVLQVMIPIPFLQNAFSTVNFFGRDFPLGVTVANCALWRREPGNPVVRIVAATRESVTYA